MAMRVDKVTKKLRFGFKKVYSLVLDEDGLYVIRTGNVGALQHYEMSGIINQLAASGITNAFVRELEKGEAMLDSTPLPELVQEKGNALIPLTEIRGMSVKRGKAPVMKLKTDQGDFAFVFTHTPEEQVELLEQALTRGDVA